MRKSIVILTIILLFSSLFIGCTKSDSEDTSKKEIIYDTKEDAVKNKLDEDFEGFKPVYEEQLESNLYVIAYYNEDEDFLCAASVEEKNDSFHWDRITPYFSITKAATIKGNKGAYVIYPVTVNDKELNICLGIVDDKTEIISNSEAHIIDNKFFVVISEDEIKVEYKS